MFYAISGINGDYEAYRRALRELRFGDIDDIEESDIMDEEAVISTLEGEDVLYVLGNMIGSGDGSMKILQDMMQRDNIIAIVGENEYKITQALKALDAHINSTGEKPPKVLVDKITSMLDAELVQPVLEFLELSGEEREDVIDYIEEITEEPFLEVYMAKKRFLLVSSGIRHFSAKKEPDEYDAEDFVSEPADMSKTYYTDRTLIVGRAVGNPSDGSIVRQGKNIAIDCGCGRGGRLGIYCLNNNSEIYV